MFDAIAALTPEEKPTTTRKSDKIEATKESAGAVLEAPAGMVERHWRTPDMGTVRIPLTQGKCAIIDADDYDRVAAHKWCAFWDRRRNRWNVHRRRKSHETGPQHIFLHRFILNAPAGVEVDHIDGDTFNNSKSNLRLCDHQRNLWNQRARKGSGYRGVYHHNDGRWRASITVHGKKFHLGSFKNAEDAARAYDRAAEARYGEFARLNFPEEVRDGR